ncbi:hypothetical protein MMC22_008539 [Lobaria immixta]|nr:hypothetical protein [Lobaria immixta]
MKFSTIAAVASFLTLASTKPLGGKHHHNHKRVLITETFTAVVTEYEYASTTLWVTAGEAPGPTSTPPASPPETHPAPVYTPKPNTRKAPKKKSTPAATQQSSSTVTPQVLPPPAPTTTEAPPPPAPKTTEAPPPPPPATTEAPPPPPPATTEAPPPPPPATTEAPPPPPPSSTPVVYAPPQPAPSQPPSSDSGAECGKVGGKCSGDVTFYDITKADFGACGGHSDGLSEDIVALAAGENPTPSSAEPS